MKIFYQDNDIIVCEKEYGVSSQKSEGANMLDMIREITGVEAFVVHRLDITTSICSKSKKCRRAFKANSGGHLQKDLSCNSARAHRGRGRDG